MKKELNGIIIEKNDNEVLIKGKKEDLLDLANYIKEIANSKLKNDHIHLDENTIIDDNSIIKNIIIEKSR